MDLVDCYILHLLAQGATLSIGELITKIASQSQLEAMDQKIHYSRKGIRKKLEAYREKQLIVFGLKENRQGFRRALCAIITKKGASMAKHYELFFTSWSSSTISPPPRSPMISSQVLPLEISQMDLESLDLSYIVAETLFSDIDQVPKEYHGKFEKVQEKILSRFQKFLVHQGASIVDDSFEIH